MPDVTPASRRSVVILRIRGADEAGSTLLEVLSSYASSLAAVGSRLMIVTDNARLIEQFRETGTIDAIGPDNVYRGTDIIGEAVRRAHDDAVAWTTEEPAAGDTT